MRTIDKSWKYYKGKKQMVSAKSKWSLMQLFSSIYTKNIHKSPLNANNFELNH